MNRDEIMEVILYYDKKGDNKVDVAQVGTCLRSLGLSPSQAQVDTFTQQWKDKGARISVEEFLPIYNNLKKEKVPSADELIGMLNNFDREGNGLIHITDLRYILTNTGEKLTSDEADTILQGVAVVDGKVNTTDLVKMIVNS